ncbi:hypothetical protein J6590_002177 [Homalodisca vitripennis]|nr:hypothetical protein J6590_002177 [Homalodisca vitripennis]
MSTEKKNEEPKWSDLGVKDKAKYLFQNITVEPMLACYIIPSVLASLATQNLNLEKACRVNLKYPDEVCDALEARQTANYTQQEVQVQQLVAGMAIWKTLLQSSIPAFLIMFLGSWSDRKGRRKPCMLMPIVGEFLTSIGLLICTYFFYQLPMEVAGVSEALFPAITGGWMTMFMAIFSYVGDITTVETRTLRIGVVNVFCSLGIPIGTALSGVLYKEIGFYGVFSLAACIYVFSFTYGLLRIKEEGKSNIQYVYAGSEQKEQWVITDKAKHIPISTGKLVEKKIGNVTSFFKDFFDLHHIKETFEVAFKEGANNRRKRVLLLMIVVMVVIGPLHGESIHNIILVFLESRNVLCTVDMATVITCTSPYHSLDTSHSGDNDTGSQFDDGYVDLHMHRVSANTAVHDVYIISTGNAETIESVSLPVSNKHTCARWRSPSENYFFY